MKEFIDNLAEKYLKLPGWVNFLVSMSIVIGILAGFIWLNGNYLHLTIGGDNTECSGQFEYNCGDVDDARMNAIDRSESRSE